MVANGLASLVTSDVFKTVCVPLFHTSALDAHRAFEKCICQTHLSYPGYHFLGHLYPATPLAYTNRTSQSTATFYVSSVHASRVQFGHEKWPPETGCCIRSNNQYFLLIKHCMDTVIMFRSKLNVS